MDVPVALTDVNRWTGLGGGFVSLVNATQGNVSHSLMWREVLSVQRKSRISIGLVLRGRVPGCTAFR